MFERIHKWLALRTYRGELGPLLVDRYGRKRYYTPPQVLATIKAHGLSQRYAAFACTMFCSKGAYEDFVAAGRSRRNAKRARAKGASATDWGDGGGDYGDYGDGGGDYGGGGDSGGGGDGGGDG